METAKNAARSVKKFVYKHRVAIAITATATACLALTNTAIRQHNDFLKEHDLYDTYYNAEDIAA